MAWIGLVFLFLQLLLASCRGADFNVSLELQGGNCSDQITLICRHSDQRAPPVWIHNDTTVEDGVTLVIAFPSAVYSVQNSTEHTATIIGLNNTRALDGHVIQCAYKILQNLTKSNAVKFSFIPPDYQPALSLVSSAAVFPKRLFEFTFTYSYQESCNLYPRCTPYFSVEHTVSPQSEVSNSSSGCIVKYTIHNLTRCVSYQSTAIAILGNQRGNPVVTGDTIMLSPGRFTITGVSIGADRNLIKVTYMENEPDCPGYPTERYTVDVDGVQVADMTADEFQSKITDLSNGFLTLSLPLSQPLLENAVTLRMTKHNTVPTIRSDVKGNIVTETWSTYAWFALQESIPDGESPPEEPTTPGWGWLAVIVVPMIILGVIAVILAFIKWRNKKKKERKEQ